MGLSLETCNYYSLKLTGRDDFKNEACLVNFVCIVFELGVKMLTLTSKEKLIVECNL